MFPLKKKQSYSRDYHKAASRAVSMSQGQLIDWIDSTGSEVAQSMSTYHRNNNKDYLRQAAKCAAVLYALLEESANRI